MKSIDLSDLLGAPEGTNVVELDDLLQPREVRKPTEVILFWTDWNCQCGRHYEMPTYGDTLTKYEIYKAGKLIYSQYEHYLEACHEHLPRRVETRHIAIPHCPQCISEAKLERDHA